MKKLVILIAFVLVAFTANAQSTLKGDVNGDGEVNVTDVTMIVEYVLGQHNSSFIMANADVNSDGSITVTDVAEAVNIILEGNQDIPHLQLSTYVVYLTTNEFNYNNSHMFVEILSGSGSYTITNSDPNVANATLSNNFIAIEAINEGLTSIEVTDTQSGQTETITVIVDNLIILIPEGSNYIHLYVGQRRFIYITGIRNYTLEFIRNQDVAEAEIYNGHSLKLTGKQDGVMIIKLTDNKNKDEDDEPICLWYVVYVELGNLWCPDDNHPHKINLGLPSGTQWACCNLGTNTPEGYGGYYAWGETSEKRSEYNEVTYQYCTGVDTDGDGFYNQNSQYQSLGSDIAGTKYDVAHVKWGGSWVMPDLGEQMELIDNCSYSWITMNGVKGGNFTGPSGGTIFLPAAGSRWQDRLFYAGSSGGYWSSTQEQSYSSKAYGLSFSSSYSYAYWINGHRYDGHTVRPVSK